MAVVLKVPSPTRPPSRTALPLPQCQKCQRHFQHTVVSGMTTTPRPRWKTTDRPVASPPIAHANYLPSVLAYLPQMQPQRSPSCANSPTTRQHMTLQEDMHGPRAQNRDPRVSGSGRDSGTTVIVAPRPFLLLRRSLALLKKRSLPSLTAVDESNASAFAIMSAFPYGSLFKIEIAKHPRYSERCWHGTNLYFTARTPCSGMDLATTYQHTDLLEHIASLTSDSRRSRSTVSTPYLALGVLGQFSLNLPFRTISTRRSPKINGALKHETSL